jgi:hypothetical protein
MEFQLFTKNLRFARVAPIAALQGTGSTGRAISSLLGMALNIDFVNREQPVTARSRKAIMYNMRTKPEIGGVIPSHPPRSSWTN